MHYISWLINGYYMLLHVISTQVILFAACVHQGKEKCQTQGLFGRTIQINRALI